MPSWSEIFNNFQKTKDISFVVQEKQKYLDEISKITNRMEQDQHLQDMILSLHHCYMIYFESTVVTKIVENNIGGCTMRLLNTNHK